MLPVIQDQSPKGPTYHVRSKVCLQTSAMNQAKNALDRVIYHNYPNTDFQLLVSSIFRRQCCPGLSKKCIYCSSTRNRFPHPQPGPLLVIVIAVCLLRVLRNARPPGLCTAQERQLFPKETLTSFTGRSDPYGRTQHISSALQEEARIHHNFFKTIVK